MLTNNQTLATFGPVWDASGARGTFGEKYKLDRLTRFVGATHIGVTFVAKTVTVRENKGNTELEGDGFTPKQLIPKTVYCTPRLWLKKVCLNCFGLSNAGIEAALKDGRWQRRTEPFMISFMPIGEKPTWQEQTEYFVYVLRKEIKNFKTLVGLQFNASCPNTGKDPLELAPFISRILDVLSSLWIPIYVKINAQFPILLAKEIAENPLCSGLIMGNTLPFGAKMPDGWPQVPWVELFGTDKPEKSPLAMRFGKLGKPIAFLENEPRQIIGDPSKAGGLSGAPLLPIVCHWIREARRAGITCHINAGGGIFSPLAVRKVSQVGANSISHGTINKFRPWMMVPTTNAAYLMF